MDALFKELAKAFGLTEETIDNFIKELEESKEKYTKSRSEALNPDGKTDEEMKADGWTLEEDINTNENGKIFRRRTWTKNSKELAGQKEAEEQQVLQEQMNKVDAWMNSLNSLLLHNWGEPDSENDYNYNTIMSFIKNVFGDEFKERNPKPLVSKYPTENLYETTDVLDTMILSELSVAENVVSAICQAVPGMKSKSTDVLKSRLIKYLNLLETEADTITDSANNMDADTIEASDGRMDEPVYNLVYLWHSMLCEYISQLMSIVETAVAA